mgnify:CR=1 FL=1|jgi:hypothetical protein|tara:strand:+ start:3238 stop:3498 length:261 start_codon:yes stop_codon:yes gene_type:complete
MKPKIVEVVWYDPTYFCTSLENIPIEPVEYTAYGVLTEHPTNEEVHLLRCGFPNEDVGTLNHGYLIPKGCVKQITDLSRLPIILKT